MTNKEFIDMIGKAAVAEYERFKILPSLTIAQAILESNWGRSMLSQKAYNYFGMKAGSSWKGATYNSKTQEQTPAGKPFTVNAAFRAYGSVAEGIRGYYVFLQYPRYQNLKGVTDYKEACRLIKADGWATDVKYTDKLIGLIEKYNLTRYDEEVLEVVEKDEIIIERKDGTIQKLKMNMIRKEGHVYPFLRELAGSMGYDVTNEGRIPKLIEK